MKNNYVCPHGKTGQEIFGCKPCLEKFEQGARAETFPRDEAFAAKLRDAASGAKR